MAHEVTDDPLRESASLTATKPSLDEVSTAPHGLTRTDRATVGGRMGTIGPLADGLAVVLLLVEVAAVLYVVRPMLLRPLWYNEQWRAWHVSLGRDFLEQLPQTDAPIAAGWAALTKLSILLLGNQELALRLPIALALPVLALVTYMTARCWLGIVASFLVAAALVCNGMIMTWAGQLEPFELEAACCVAAFLLWIQANQPGVRGRARWWRYIAIGACAITAIPVVFVLGPLLLVDLIRAAQTRTWWRLGPSVMAGGLALTHLLLFLLPQTSQRVGPYWNGYFLPHSPVSAALRFLGGQLASFVPGMLTLRSSSLPSVPEAALPLGSRAEALLTALLLVALAAGVVAALLEAQLRPLVAVVVGCLVAQAVASSLRLWPFGFVRPNTFLLPFCYLLGGVGLAFLIRRLRGVVGQPAPRDARDRPAHLPRWSAVVALGLAAVLAAGTAELVAVSARQVGAVRREAVGPAFATGMADLVAITRRRAEPGDLVVLEHWMAPKGWDYYMRFHDGDRVAPTQGQRIGPDRTIRLDGRAAGGQRLGTFITRSREARHVFVMVLFGTRGKVVHADLATITAAGFQPTRRWTRSHTGTLYELTRSHAAPPVD